MTDSQDYQKTISRYQTRISFVALIIAGFLLGIGFWVRQLLGLPTTGVAVGGVELKRLEFEILRQGLVNKSEPVILEQKVEAEKGIGKSEPFQ